MSAGGCSTADAAGAVVGAKRGAGLLSSGRADGNAVALGRGVDSSSSVLGFARGITGVADGEDFFPFPFGVSSSSSSSELGDFFAAGVLAGSGSSSPLAADEVLPLFDFFFAGFGFAAGESDFAGVAEGMVCISSRALRNASRFFLSSSLICACRSEVTAPVTARRASAHVTKRAEPPRPRERGCLFKRAEAPRPLRHRASRRAPVPGAGSHLIFHREGAANR